MLCISLFVFALSQHAPVCQRSLISRSNWLFINAVMLAAHAAISREEAELDLVD